MDWMKSLGPMLDQYGSAPRAEAIPPTVNDDYDRLAQQAPPDVLSEGLAAAFRSDQTPEFARMASQMFGRASGAQRANILNMLLQVAGPMVLQQIARRQAGGGAAAGAPAGRSGGLGDILGQVLGGGQPRITEKDAERIDPAAVEDLAREAEKKDPSIVDKLSRVYAEQPQLLKALGGMALAIALGRMAQRRGTL
jgi:hypothetical protein